MVTIEGDDVGLEELSMESLAVGIVDGIESRFNEGGVDPMLLGAVEGIGVGP